VLLGFVKQAAMWYSSIEGGGVLAELIDDYMNYMILKK
jgi:hypothetical protein